MLAIVPFLMLAILIMRTQFLSFLLITALTSIGTHSTSESIQFNPAYRKGRLSVGKEIAGPPLTVKDVLKVANEHFTYQGKAIHPGLVQEFECWISDLNPVTVAVDVSA
jgi:hypothetical protein